MSNDNETTTILNCTGERMVPEFSDDGTFWEHIYRYRFAAQFARGRDVLDVACGEGYGSRGLLMAGASSVIGVDVAQEACNNARTKYGIDARCGSATAMPIGDESVDLVVSFETIEHIAEHDLFVDECFRVLKNGGTMIISTPNRDAYSENGARNPFHIKELDKDEFVRLLSRRFGCVRLYTQRPQEVLAWSLRSLAASRSQWRNIRGYWSLRRLLAGSASFQELADADRGRPAELIGQSDTAISSLVNPYLVRPWSRFTAERPRYFVAVCEKGAVAQSRSCKRR